MDATKTISTAAANSASDSESHQDDSTIELGDLWDTLYNELVNMGRALTCPLCLSTYTDAVVLPCVHAYCNNCLLAAFQCGQPRCPTCLTKATKRSMAPAPILNQLVHAYKLSLRQFGLAPVQYDPQYNAMTQLGPGEGAVENTGMTIELLDTTRSRRSALRDCHTHLQVSRTWQKVLQERQDKENSTSCDDSAAGERSDKLPNHIPTKTRLRQWQQQQQAQVIASHERALIDAVKERKNPKPSPVINLSEQQEISMEHALEQTAADQRWTQESDNNSNVNGHDSGSQYLTPREVPATDSNPQQQLEQSKRSIPLARMPPEVARKNNGRSDGNISRPKEEEPFCTAESFETSRETSDSHPQQRSQIIGKKADDHSSSSLFMAESFESTADGQLNDGDDDNKDKDTVMPMEQEDEESVDEKGHEVQAAAGVTMPCRATPLQSNAVSRTGRDVDYGNGSDDYEKYVGNNGIAKSDSVGDTSGDRHRYVEIMSDVGLNTAASQEKEDYDYTFARNENGNDLSAIENNDQGYNPKGNDDDEIATDGSACRCDDNEGKGPEFKLGDIVHVQARTWPGVNKPGGVARITKIFPESSSYHVEYILGGREKSVDAIFISHPPDDMVVKEEPEDNVEGDTVQNTKADRARKSRRISKKRQVKVDTDVPNPEDILPPELLESLSKEGFDVKPSATSTTGAGKENLFPRVKVESDRVASGRPTRSRSHLGTRDQGRIKAPARRTKSADITLAGRDTSRGRKRRATQPLQVSKVTAKQDLDKNVSTSETHDDANNKKQATTSKTATKKKAVKTTTSATTGKIKSTAALKSSSHPNKRQKSRENSGPSKLKLPASSAEICQLADDHYNERIQGALDASSVTIVASGLSETDKSDLKALSKEAKKSGIVIKQTESFHPSKITLCIIPGVISKDDPKNLVGQCRTLKAMRSALAGVPLVSSSWIGSCRSNKRVTMPTESMYIRTLPVKKSSDSRSKACADYGVAKIAAQASQRANFSLGSCTVQLCGSFLRPPKADVQLLLRESGAKLSLQTSSTLATLRKQTSEYITVLLCDDTCATIPDALLREVKSSLGTGRRVIVVNPQWLFDSVVSGLPMEANEYAPSKGQPLELWKLHQ